MKQPYELAVMFNIAMDESGATCNSHELVKDKSVSDVGNAKKRKYFCVTCQDEKHPVFLKIRHKIQKMNTKARNYKSAAWFSHHGRACEGENSGGSKRDNPSPETALHWQAKHILCKDVERYSYVTSRCTGCGHTHVEYGTGACARVEHTEKKADGKHYRFDVVLMRGDTVSSVMEVWATHETCELKRKYCLEMGFTFSEFDAQHVIDTHNNALEGESYELENLKIRYFECQECEFYNKTCTGAETRIIQLHESLYANYLDEICHVTAKQQAIKTACARADKIRSGTIKHNFAEYEAGVSFKCFCGKWVREDTSMPVCRRIYQCERNEKFFQDMQNSFSIRTYKSIFPDRLHMKMCGLCSIQCITCNDFFLLRTAVTTGMCPACDSSAFSTEGHAITRLLKNDIAYIYAGDEFRGFFDFAIEYRPIFLAQYAARQLQMARDEIKRRQQVRHEKNQIARDQKKKRLQGRHEKIQKTKNEMNQKTFCEAGSQESRFTEFMIERRKQIENLDQATQRWKTKNFTAWSKKELWQQERDRELSFAVYRQGRPNPYTDFN